MTHVTVDAQTQAWHFIDSITYRHAGTWRFQGQSAAERVGAKATYIETNWPLTPDERASKFSADLHALRKIQSEGDHPLKPRAQRYQELRNLVKKLDKSPKESYDCK